MTMNGQIQKQVTHEIRMLGRKEMSVTGVKEVISFDESCVLLRSECGEVTVEGSGLHVGTLDTERGVVILSGRMDGVYYTDDRPEQKRGFFGRLFQ